MIYSPDANDARYLEYLPHGPEFDGSHLIKTNIRGRHGQHPDRVLIKKARRHEKAQSHNRETQPKASGFPKVQSRVKWDHPGKRDWPKRPFQKRMKP